MSDELLQLSDADLRQIVAALQAGRIKPPFSDLSVQRFVPDSISQKVAIELQQLADQGFSAQQLATCLDLILKDRKQRLPAEGLIELVTTGPEAPGIANRDTSVVVRELFAQATTSVLVAGYAVHKGQRIFQTLAERMEQIPDLRVEMFLDVQRPQGDSSNPLEIVRRFAHRFRNEQWPIAKPLPQIYYDPRSLETEGKFRASLHAKCIVVDCRSVFVSSANFTEAAQQRNIEIGLLIRSASLAEKITRHFAALVSECFLKPIF